MSTDKGQALNERVWKLFDAAGFLTKPNSNDSQEEEVALSTKKKRRVDLSASVRELNVKIIGWNKARKALTEDNVSLSGVT
jgi:hypothetical protein